jgi:ankyrin repeat protein
MQIENRLSRWLRLSLLLVALTIPPVLHAFSRVTFATDAFFAQNSAVLSLEALRALDDFVQRTFTVAPSTVIIQGYADPGEQDPLALSGARAQAVKRYLVNNGIAPQIIHWEAKGVVPTWFNDKRQTPSKQQRLNRVTFIELIPGVTPTSEAYFGFASSLDWFTPNPVGSSQVTSDPEWATVTPHSLAASISDVDLRHLFLQRVLLAAVTAAKSDVVAQLRVHLQDCATVDKPLPNLYLYATLAGDRAMQEALSSCRPSASKMDAEISRLVIGIYCLPRVSARSAEFGGLPQWLESMADTETTPELSPSEWGACAERNPNVVKWFAMRGANPNTRDKYGNTGLRHALQILPVEVVKILLQLGANPNQPQNRNGGTALHLVSQRRDCTFMVCRPTPKSVLVSLWDTLIEFGADPTIADNNGKLPIKPR